MPLPHKSFQPEPSEAPAERSRGTCVCRDRQKTPLIFFTGEPYHRSSFEKQFLMTRKFVFLCTLACLSGMIKAQTASDSSSQEKHLRNIRQLTFGGQNAEARSEERRVGKECRS